MYKDITIILFCLLTFSIFLASCQATQINVTKDSASQINIGDTLTVNIHIKNLESSEAMVSVQEFVSGATPVDPPTLIYLNTSGGFIAAVPPFYRWNLNLTANEERVITYKVIPLNFGTYEIGPTTVAAQDGQTFYSNTLSVKVLCKYTGVCDPSKGENYFSCPANCPSGSKDGVCDMIKDGRCDPDCLPGTDPDCASSTTVPNSSSTTTTSSNQPACGNYICESGENYSNCPQDCPKATNLTLVYVIVGIVVGVLVAIIIIWSRRSQ